MGEEVPAHGGPVGRAVLVAEVEDLLLQVMPDREKVGRLARLTGTLRYAEKPKTGAWKVST